MAPSTTASTSTKPANTTSQHDINILLNRTSVALARSQRLVDSWLPSSTTNDAITSTSHTEISTNTTNNDSANGLAALLSEVGRSERAGLGFVDPDAGNNGIGGARSGVESELEKLRRQMLGKRGAKQQQAQAATRGGKGGATLSAGGQVGRMEVAGAKTEVARGQTKRKEVDSEDEEEGRSGAFRSKKKKVKAEAEIPKAKDMAAVDEKKAADVPEANTTASTAGKQDKDASQSAVVAPGVPAAKSAKVDSESDSDNKSSTKKKPTSYLNEILEKREKKKKKKKRNKSGGGAVAENGGAASAT